MRTLLERLEAHSIWEPNSGCLLWEGAYRRHPIYPLHSRPVLAVPLGDKRWRTRNAARVNYELHNGPVPDGLQILHTCDNPGCIALNHIYAGTHLDNMADMVRRGRSPKPNPPPCCPQGHLFTPENTRTKPWGKYQQRLCRTCEAEYNERIKGTPIHRAKVQRAMAARKAKLNKPSQIRLTPKMVLEIRSSPLSNCELGRRLGVDHSTVRNARIRKSWKHIP